MPGRDKRVHVLGRRCKHTRNACNAYLRTLRCRSSPKNYSVPDVPSRRWFAGFLAGFFDAEGSYIDGIMRLSNTNKEIICWLERSLREFGFRYVVEHIDRKLTKPIDYVRVTGGLVEHLRFFHTVDPAITRKRDISGQAVKSKARLDVVASNLSARR